MEEEEDEEIAEETQKDATEVTMTKLLVFRQVLQCISWEAGLQQRLPVGGWTALDSVRAVSQFFLGVSVSVYCLVWLN